MSTVERVMEELQQVDVSGKRVAVQIPEGLKQYAGIVIDVLRAGGAEEVILFIDPNYGACDIRDSEAKRVGAEVLIHLGHSSFGKIIHEIPVIYVPITLDLDLQKIMGALREIKGRIALCSTVHYTKYIEKIRRALGDKIVVGKGTLAAIEGQVLGCDSGACSADADVNVVITDGIFHGILVKMQTGRKTFVLTPAGELIDVGPYVEDYLRQRETAKILAGRAKRVGVVIATKKGQINMVAARKIMGILGEKGVRADILACDYFLPEYVKGMPYDAYVFTGCPRVAISPLRRRWKYGA